MRLKMKKFVENFKKFLEKKKNRIIFIISIIIILIIIIVTSIFVINSRTYTEQTSEGITVNVSNQLAKPKKVENLDITNISLKKEDNVSNLTVTVENNTQEPNEPFDAIFTFIDRNGNEISQIASYIEELQPGEKYQIELMAPLDYVEAYDFTVEKISE